MSSKKSPVILEIAPTIFPDYNKKNELAADHETVEITVNRLKHKHFRIMQSMKGEKQIHYIMTELTGLTQIDIDELDADDSAELSDVIFTFMSKYTELAKKLAGNFEK